MSESAPSVSVVMLCHRVSSYLPVAVASVFNQTWRDLELVLVDNGAGLTPAHLGAGGQDPRLRFVRLAENFGVPRGMEAGLAAARGEFVALLDHDDIALPERVAQQVDWLRRDPRLGLVGSCAQAIDRNGAKIGREFALTASEEVATYLPYAMPVVTPVFSGRRVAFRQFPHRPELKWAPDYDQVTRIAEAWKIAVVPHVLTCYRRHAEQVTVTRSAEMLLEQCAVRILTARRRAGRDERFAEMAAAVAAARGEAPAIFYARFARQCLSEGFGDLAVYHARKAFQWRRTPAGLGFALRMLARGLSAAPARRPFLVRLFLRGPVRALGLHPDRS